MFWLNDLEHWRQLRSQNMVAARMCKKTLTNPDGHWRYSPDDPRVIEAVGKWVARSRNAHAFAIGRKPVIEKFLYAGPEGVVDGPLVVPRRAA